MVKHVFSRYSVLEFVAVLDSNQQLTEEDAAYFPALLEEALLLLIQIVSELPLPPPQSDDNLSTRVTLQLRRELVHRLVSGPKTYSQLQECLSLVPDVDKCDSTLLDKVIESISVQRDSSSALEAPSLWLRSELWSEYDPAYNHIPASAHQTAFENRPKLDKPAPMTIRSHTAHDLFKGLQYQVLCDSVLLSTLKILILSTAARRCPNDAKYDYLREANAMFINDSLYNRVLHLTTLIAHLLSSVVSRSLNDSYFLSISDFFASSHSSASPTSSNLSSSVESDWEDTIEKKDVHVEPCIFQALTDLFTSYASPEEINLKFWHRWILEECAGYIPKCREFLSNIDNNTKVEDRKAILEVRKKQAKEKALAAMKASASAFASHAETELADLKAIDDAHAHQSTGCDVPFCIVCQEISNDVIGYLGLSQVMHMDIDCSRPYM